MSKVSPKNAALSNRATLPELDPAAAPRADSFGPRISRPRSTSFIRILSRDKGLPEAADIIGVFGIFILSFIGYIKGSTYLSAFPLNPTSASLAVVLVIIIGRIPGRPYLNHWHIMLLTALALAFALGIRAPDNVYMSSKLTALMTVLPATLMGGMYILRNEKTRLWWVWINVGYGFLVLALTQLDPAINATGQLATAGGNPIGSARATGAALTVLGCYFLFGKHRYMTLAGMAVMAFGTVSAAERGPALAAIVAVMVTAGLAPQRGRLLRLILIGGALAGLGWWLAKGGFIGAKLTETGDVSSASRLRLWSAAWDFTLHHPFGIGWGGLFDALPTNEHLSSGYVQYPHNVVLEVSSEAGLLAVLSMLAVIVVSFVLQRRRANTAIETAMLGLFIFFAVNSLVSSDVTGNRGLWVAVGAGLATQFIHKAKLPIGARPGRAATPSDRHRESAIGRRVDQ